MPDNLTQATVICQGGLDSTQNHLLLDQSQPGAATRLVNFEIGEYGGYRRLSGFRHYDTTYTTVDDTNAEGRILGIAIYRDYDGTETVMAARKQKSGATYKWYKLTLTGWQAYAPGFNFTSTGVVKIRHAKVTFGDKSYIIFVDGVNNAVVFDGTTWYKLESGVQAGTSADPGGNQIIDAPKYVTVFQKHIFLSGDSTSHAVVCHSAPEDVFNWNVSAGAGQIPAGFKVKNIKPFRDNLFVFGNPGLKRINVDSTTFVMNDVATSVGLVATDSVLEIGGDLIFLSQDGVRTISGTDKIGDVNLASISKQVLRIVKFLQETYDLDYLNGVLVKNKTQFRYFVHENEETAVGRGLIGGLRPSAEGGSWEYGELYGIRVSCVENDYIDSQETILHGDYDGSVYIQETGNTFGGQGVTAIFTTPFLTFGDPIQRKLGRKLHTFVRPEGTLTMTITLVTDWLNSFVTNPLPFSDSLGTTFTYYDDGSVYDGGQVYGGGDSYPVIDTDILGSFKSLQITYTTSGTESPYSIHGYVIELTPQGKR